MPKAILKPIGSKWQVVIFDEKLEVNYTDSLTHEEAQAVADDYNQKDADANNETERTV